MHLLRNREKVEKEGGHMMLPIKGRNFELRVVWERVDTMEENTMRTTTIDGKTQQHKEKAQLTNSKQVPSLHFSANICTTLSE